MVASHILFYVMILRLHQRAIIAHRSHQAQTVVVVVSIKVSRIRAGLFFTEEMIYGDINFNRFRKLLI